MKILVASATLFEILPLKEHLTHQADKIVEDSYFLDGNEIQIFVTGVGIPSAVYSLTKLLQFKKYDLILNPGIAGAFINDSKDSLRLGDVVEVASDRFADLGAEEKDGSFTDLIEMGLADKAISSALKNNSTENFNFLRKARGITVNKVHGQKNSIDKIMKKYPDAEVESMEGAGIVMVCESENIEYLQIRAISNYIEPRNRDAWQIEQAIDNLNIVLKNIILKLTSNTKK